MITMASKNSGKKVLKQNTIKHFGYKDISPQLHELNVQRQVIIDKERQEKELKALKLKMK